MLHPSTIAALTVCVIFALATPSDAQTRPTVEKLLAAFDDVVFGAEFDQTMRTNMVVKWDGPLRISARGNEKDIHLNYLRGHLNKILSLTGLRMGRVDPEKDPANIQILFLPADQMDDLKINLPDGTGPTPNVVDPKLIQTLAGARGCYFLSFRNPPDQFTHSVIVVNKERTSRAINHCLLEEVLQSLGLPNDSNLIRPSIFSDLDKLIEVTRSDEILIRTLYDPRMKPGTDRKAALLIARDIITELDASLPLR